MEFWVVAAATGAGYVAKHWQNLSGEKNGSGTMSPMVSPRVQPDTCQLFSKTPKSVFTLPKLAKRCLLDGNVSSSEEEHPVSGSASIFNEKPAFQDSTDETNGAREYFDNSGHLLNEFRTKKSKRKSFSSLRPLVVTSNSRDCQRKQTTKDHNIDFMDKTGEFMEEEFFEPSGSVKLPRKPDQTPVKRFETEDLHSQGNDMVPLFLGIAIGILSTYVSNQREVEHLSELLEQAENIVQDLHRKLEIKEGFTENKCCTEADRNAADSPKADNYDLPSDIEAELEAELEKLEENMKGFSLPRLSNVLEIDSDFEADMARGDLNLDALTWQLDSRSKSDYGDKRVESESPGKPCFTPNYAVSSLDLRLRLHEVIETELRARIDELEAVVQNQNRQSKASYSPESQEENSFWDFDHTRIESFSSTP